jgi:hypothetical protein
VGTFVWFDLNLVGLPGFLRTYHLLLSELWFEYIVGWSMLPVMYMEERYLVSIANLSTTFDHNNLFLQIKNNANAIATGANIYKPEYRNSKWSQIDIMRPEKKKKKKQGSTKGLDDPNTRGSAVRSRGVWSQRTYSLLATYVGHGIFLLIYHIADVELFQFNEN